MTALGIPDVVIRLSLWVHICIFGRQMREAASSGYVDTVTEMVRAM